MTALTAYETDGPFHTELVEGRWVVFVVERWQRLSAIRHRAGEPHTEWELFELEDSEVGWQVSAWTDPDVDAVQVAVNRGECTAIVHDGAEPSWVVKFKGKGRWWKR